MSVRDHLYGQLVVAFDVAGSVQVDVERAAVGRRIRQRLSAGRAVGALTDPDVVHDGRGRVVEEVQVEVGPLRPRQAGDDHVPGRDGESIDDVVDRPAQASCRDGARQRNAGNVGDVVSRRGDLWIDRASGSQRDAPAEQCDRRNDDRNPQAAHGCRCWCHGTYSRERRGGRSGVAATAPSTIYAGPADAGSEVQGSCLLDPAGLARRSPDATTRPVGPVGLPRRGVLADVVVHHARSIRDARCHDRER